MRLLSRAMILTALEELARELAAMGTTRQEEIVLAGGAALVLMDNAREATRDAAVCAVASGPAALREAARRVAATLGLPEDWLNDGAKGYLKGLLPGEVLLDRPALLV